MGRVNKLMVKRIGVMLLILISGITHANLKIENGSLTLESGDVLTVEDITINSSGTLKGDLSGGASIRVSGSWSNSGTFIHNNDAVYLTGTGTSTISGTNTFHTLISDHAETDTGPGKDLKFDDNNAQTITSNLTLKGSSGNLMPVSSSISDKAATLNVSGATVNAEYLNITDSILFGYDSYPGDTNNNTDSGGNSGWFNRAPTASAGPDQTVSSGARVTLDGSASSDPNGEDLTYTWTQTEGSEVALDTQNPAKPTFLAPMLGANDSSLTLVFRLTVKDDMNLSNFDTVSITVNPPDNNVPTARAGPDQTVSSGARVILDGLDSSDPDGGSLTYTWTQTEGTEVALDTQNPAKPTFLAPMLGANDSSLTLIFSLTVIDDKNVPSQADTVSVIVKPTAGTTEPAIAISISELALNEGSAADFTVKMMDSPAANVVINATSSDETKATLSLSTLSFTKDNLNVEQTVTVTAVNDYTLNDSSVVITLAVDQDNSDSPFHNVVDQTISISIGNTEIPLELIQQFSNGDGSTPSPPTLSIYEEAGISGVTANNLVLVNATVLAADKDGADTVSKVQALVDGVNNPPANEIAFNPADFIVNDPVISSVLEKYAIELASIVINKENGKYTVVNHKPNSPVMVGTGRPGSELINIDIDSDPEIYITIKASVDSNKMAELSKTGMIDQVFLWNPKANTFLPVTISFEHAKDSPHEVSDYIGYPLGGMSMPNASFRMQIAGATDKSDQSVILWGHAKGQMAPVTRPITSASQPNSNGRYAWQVTAEDYIKSLDIGDNLVLAKSSASLSLPLAITVTGPEVKLSLSANRNQAQVGSVVTYTAQLENKSIYPLSAISIRNDLPQGFKYVESSAYWDHDGDAQTPMVGVDTSIHEGGKVLQFDLGNVMESPIGHKLRYQLRIGSGVNEGTYSNTVVVVDNNGTADTIVDDTSLQGSQASADIRVVEDALFELSTVIGKVFNDVNGNGIQDEGDLPVPYAKLVTSAGQQVTVDANGQYHLSNMRPGRMVVRIDERSLPDQTKIVGHRSQIVDIRPGLPSKVNFAVQLPSTADSKHTVRIEQLSKTLKPTLSISAFGAAQIDSQQQGFVEPLQIRAYSNYGAFIKQWRVVIREDFSRRVVKTFSGTGLDLFGALYWDGLTDEGEFIDPQRKYNVELLVSDSGGREASTYGQSLVLVDYTEQPELSMEGDRDRSNAHGAWLRRLAGEDKTARSHIRMIGKSIRVTGEHFGAVRVSQDNQVLVEMPSYDQSQYSVTDILRGISLNKSLSQNTHIELIVPKGKLNVQVLANDTQISANAKQNPEIKSTIVQDHQSGKASVDFGSPPAQDLEEQVVNTEVTLATEKQPAHKEIPVAIDNQKINKQNNTSKIGGSTEKLDRDKPELVQELGTSQISDNLQAEEVLTNTDNPPTVTEQQAQVENKEQISATELVNADTPELVREQEQKQSVVKSIESEGDDRSEGEISKDMSSSEEIISNDKSPLIEEQQIEIDTTEGVTAILKDKELIKTLPVPELLPYPETLDYQIPTVSSEFISDQRDYNYTVQLQLANDRKELLDIVSQYQTSLDISRFAVIDMPHHAGSRYALIYGLYKSTMEAKRALRKVSKVVRDNAALKHSLQVRPLKSMQKRQQVKHTLDKVLVEKLAYVLNQINEFIFPKASAADLSDQITLMSDAEADSWLARLQIARQRYEVGHGFDPSWFESSGAQSLIGHRQNQHNGRYLQQQDHYPYLTASVDLDKQLYKVPAVGIEYLLDQEEYSHTIELSSGNDTQQLLQLAEEYSQTQNISRFALLIVAQEDGNYSLIYGIYHTYKEAKHTLQGELPRALADSGAQIRSIKSLSLNAVAMATVSQEGELDQSHVLFEQTIDTQELAASDDYFLVGIVDAEIAYRDIKDNVALAKSGDSRYGDKIWKDGKIQLYFKGTVAGDYLVTASIDSERDSDDLFSNLDPDASYALYGDNASVNDLVTEADGALYLLVEKDLSWAKWGRLQAALDNSELASFQRSLQGAQVHYESRDSTSYGEAVTEIDAFQATARQKASRVEFLSTGSSVYYLKHQDVIRDSLKLKVEVRDAVSGNIRSSQMLEMGNDYQFNAQSGRIMFWEPPEREVESELLMTKHNYALDQVYLIADYNYSIADDWSQGVSGAELKQAVSDNVIVGVTKINEQKLDSDYSLEGLNSTIYINADHSLTLEYARSESRNEPQFYSDDGGLSWGAKSLSYSDSELISGDAFSLRGQASLSEERTNISYYGRSITHGFHSGYSSHFRGQKSIGFDIDHRLNEQLSARFKHHQQTDLNKTAEDDNESSSTLQAIYDLSDKLELTGEFQNLNNGGTSKDNIALQGRYQLSEKTAFSLTQQTTLNVSSGSQTRLGVYRRISDNLIIEGAVRDNQNGLFYGINSDYSLGEKLSLGAGLEQDDAGLLSARVGTGYMPNKDAIYRLSVDSSALENGKSSRGLSLSTEHRMGESASLNTGTSLSTSGDDSRNSEDAKLSYELADGREVYGSVSHYEYQDNETLDDGHEISLGGDITASWQGFFTLGQGDLHRVEGIVDKRKILTVGTSYVRPTEDQQKQLQGRLRYEVRQDRGMDNIDAKLLDLNVRGRLSQDITLIGSLNWGLSENLDNGSVQAKNNRFDLNVAYRPLLQDSLNIIGKYSWVEDKQPQDQIGDLGFEAQKAQVLSADILYDLSSKWSLGAKLAVRHGEEKVQDLPWADSRRWLMASRIGYGLFEDTKLNIEYRSLKDARARDDKDGIVIELVRRFNQKIEVAVGINYAGFSDDLGLMDYTEQRGYLRITSVFE